MRRALAIMLAFCAISAIGGGVALIINGAGMRESTLAGSPVPSLFVAGVVLMGVGAASAVAAALVMRRSIHAPLAATLAGVVLSHWIWVEWAVIGPHWLQLPYAVLAVVIAALGWRLRSDPVRSR